MREKQRMTIKVELVPLVEGNRITVTEGEKIIVGRGSSLGCNEKKISRHHAELSLKTDHTLWIKPTHANPVFYRALNGKIIQLTKDIERELKDGDQIGLLPSSYYFRVSFSKDLNNNENSDSDSPYSWKKDDNASPVRPTSPDRWSPSPSYRRSNSKKDPAVFDFEDEATVEPIKTPSQRISFEKKVNSPTVEPKLSVASSPSPLAKARVSISQSDEEKQDGSKANDDDSKSRKLPKWMSGSAASSNTKPTTTTPTSSYSRTSSQNGSAKAKRQLSFEGDSNGDMNESSNMSDATSPNPIIEKKSPGKVLSRVPSTKSIDGENNDATDSPKPKTSPLMKKVKRNSGRRRPSCPFGPSCYRKNPVHRAEQSHPGDSDYEDAKTSDNNFNDDDDKDKPECPFGKSCYRQNPQHKRDFRH